jgi:hypothetical protein
VRRLCYRRGALQRKYSFTARTFRALLRRHKRAFMQLRASRRLYRRISRRRMRRTITYYRGVRLWQLRHLHGKRQGRRPLRRAWGRASRRKLRKAFHYALSTRARRQLHVATRRRRIRSTRIALR